MADGEFLLEQATLDRIKRIGGEKLLARLAMVFLEDVPPKVSLLKKALANKDWAAIERVAHSIKSSAGNLGAMELYGLAGELESQSHNIAASGCRDSGITSLVTDFERQFTLVVTELKRLKESYHA